MTVRETLLASEAGREGGREGGRRASNSKGTQTIRSTEWEKDEGGRLGAQWPGWQCRPDPGNLS